MTTSSQRNIKHIKRKRKAGLCGYMGCHEKAESSYLCLNHAKRHTDYMRALYFKKAGRSLPEVKREYKKIA